MIKKIIIILIMFAAIYLGILLSPNLKMNLAEFIYGIPIYAIFMFIVVLGCFLLDVTVNGIVNALNPKPYKRNQ